VVSGYSILQPRIQIRPEAGNASLFAWIGAGDSGIDPYSLAVSDVYQDLFGEGSYVGKGIYDVEAFERSLEGRIPENALLSHDLFEGIHGGVGLATDIILFEDYPSIYLVKTSAGIVGRVATGSSYPGWDARYRLSQALLETA